MNRDNEQQEYENAEKWLKENGEFKISQKEKEYQVWYKVFFKKKNETELITLEGVDLKGLIIKIYQEAL